MSKLKYIDIPIPKRSVGRPAKIIVTAKKYLDEQLDAIRKQDDKQQQLQDGAKLMMRIVDMNELFEAAYLELRGIIGLRQRS